VESHVLATTDFRSEREVEELWDALVKRLTVSVEDALRTETDPDTFLRVKETLIAFIMTLEVGRSPYQIRRSDLIGSLVGSHIPMRRPHSTH
jgi:hypothetical protein